MDYPSMNHGAWTSCLPVFRNLLRPSTAVDPVAGTGSSQPLDEGITAARAGSGRFGATGDSLADIVFGGDPDWYSYGDAWVLQSLAAVLDDEGAQERQILGRLVEITGAQGAEALGAALESLVDYVDGCLGAWQRKAAEEGRANADMADAGGGVAVLEGTPNDANWQACRTPGTRYYVYHEGRYLYCDLQRAALDAWAELPERESAANAAARPWGDLAGASYTPTNNREVYGDDYVYRVSPDGEWLTMAQAEATAFQSGTGPGEQEIIEPYGQGFMKAVDGKWLYGSSRSAAHWYADYTQMLRAEGLDQGDALGSVGAD